MRKNKTICLLVSILSSTLSVFSINNDSIFVERILREVSSFPEHKGKEEIILFAKKFLDLPYCGGTLDSFSEESLVVRTDSFDCTTFVETVLAMYTTSRNTGNKYEDFCNSLRLIRYRDGCINGYTSRLHYFSDWVDDNSRKGILYEVTDSFRHCVRKFSLNYMTSHYDLYPKLKCNQENVIQLKKLEKKWHEYEMPYIPKESLLCSEPVLGIENGDIIALTTSIEGLGVVHLGFAFWQENKLHLLHASSLHKKVIIDKEPLYNYLKKRKKHTGIRVIRIK